MRDMFRSKHCSLSVLDEECMPSGKFLKMKSLLTLLMCMSVPVTVVTTAIASVSLVTSAIASGCLVTIVNKLYTKAKVCLVWGERKEGKVAQSGQVL